MSDADILKQYLRVLRKDGGRVGAWTVAAEDGDAGGMGVVLFGARRDIHGQLQRAAIKFQNPESLPDGTKMETEGLRSARFAHEFEILQYLQQYANSEYIATPYDGGTLTVKVSGGRTVDIQFFAQERMSGESLETILKRGPLDSNAWLGLAHDLLQAATAMHRVHVIHQDLKPANVMVHHGHYVTVDLGLASYINRKDPGDHPGYSLGWAAPEQLSAQFRGGFDGSTNAGHVDIYAVGCILAAAAGQRPWQRALTAAMQQAARGKTDVERQMILVSTLLQSMQSSAPELELLSPWQRKIVEPMLVLDHTKRTDAATALRAVTKAMAPTHPLRQAAQAQIQKAAAARPVPRPRKPQSASNSQAKQSAELSPKASSILMFVFVLPITSIFGWGIPFAVGMYIWKSRRFAWIEQDQRAKLVREVAKASVPIFGIVTSGAALTAKPRSKGVVAMAVATILVNCAMFAGDALPEDSIVLWFGLAAALGSGMILTKAFAAASRLAPTPTKPLKSPKPSKKSAQQPVEAPVTAAAAAETNSDGHERAFAEDSHGRPVLPTTWRDIAAEIYPIFEEADKSKQPFSFDAAAESIKGVYIQGYYESDGSVTIECSADLSVRPKITRAQKEALNRLGWEDPAKGLPNFIRFLDVASSTPEALTEIAIATLRDGYGIRVDELQIR